MIYGRTVNVPVTIASSGTESSSAEVGNMLLSGIVIPSAFTGATIAFKWSFDNSTFMDVVETDGTAVSYTATDGDVVRVDPSGWAFAGQGFLKVVSASSEGAERKVNLLFRTA